MHKQHLTLSALILLLLMLGTSCTHRYLDFTIISTKNMEFNNCNNFVKGKNRVEGIDKVHWIIIIPTGSVSVKEAVDKAIESTPGCVALMDGVIYNTFWWIPYIYGQQSVTVEGTPLINPAMVSEQSELPAYGVIKLNSKKEVESATAISETEYKLHKKRMTAAAKLKPLAHN